MDENLYVEAFLVGFVLFSFFPFSVTDKCQRLYQQRKLTFPAVMPEDPAVDVTKKH